MSETTRRSKEEFYIYVSEHSLILRGQTCFSKYLLTPWSIVLLEKLTGSQLVKKFPAFYGTRRFTTTFTRVRHRSLS